MTVLSLAGGIIFLLPFLQEVYYKPLADALSLNNTEVGSLLSIFGVTSMISYFPGGWLADRVSPRKLVSGSLLATGAAGLYFATFPSYKISLAIHAFWGFAIALLFWGAMIRATRMWASSEDQGKAFGILETGRGVGEIAASMTALAVFGLLGSGKFALVIVITGMSGLIVILGIAAWIVLDDGDSTEAADNASISLEDVITVLRMPIVWLIATVIFTGYSAYWGTFRFTPYATDIFGLSVTIAAWIAVAKMWLKPFAAFVAGIVSDKIGIAKTVAFLFVVLVGNYVLFALLPGKEILIPLMLANIALASLAVFAMRGIYFALLEEGGVPMAVTGTAAGIVSVIGFTPDIFMPIMGGWLIDTYPGETGYDYFFLSTAAICAVGFVASLVIFYRYVANQPSTDVGDA